MPGQVFKSLPPSNQPKLPVDQLNDLSAVIASTDIVEIQHDPAHGQTPGKVTLAQLVAAGGGGGGGGGSGALGALITDAPGVASVNDYAPAGFGTSSGGLDVTAAVGGTALTGLLAGGEGQMVEIRNLSATDDLTLLVQNVGSSAANRFRGSSDLTLSPGQRTIAVYRAGGVNRWSIG